MKTQQPWQVTDESRRHGGEGFCLSSANEGANAELTAAKAYGITAFVCGNALSHAGREEASFF